MVIEVNGAPIGWKIGVRQDTSALMGIPRLRSMGFLIPNVILRSLSICFPQVILMSTHRFSVISVINVVTN